MSDRAQEASAGPRALDAQSLLAATREVVAELHPHLGAGAEITLDSSLDRDLGLDSLSRMELLARLERAFGVTIPETVMANVETARELLPALQAGGRRERAAAAVRDREARLEAVDAIPAGASTLLEAVDFHARRHGDNVHVELLESDRGPSRITFAALVDRAERIAAGLAHRGLEPGQAAGLMLPTGFDYLAAFLAVQMAGAVPVPIYPPARLSQLEDHLRRHAGILANARARTLVTFAPALGVSRLLTAQVPGLGSVVDVAGLDRDGRLRERPGLDASSTAFLQYTSGSTGDPKGVVLSHGDVLASLKSMAAALEATPRDVFVSWLPLYHDMGLIGGWMGSLYYGFPLVLMSPLDFLARPVRWLEAIHRHRGTLSGAPNFAYDLCVRRIEPDRVEGLDLSSWRIAFNGAEQVNPDTMSRFTAKFAPLGLSRSAMTPVYGLAEATLGVAFTPTGRGPRIDTVDADAIARRGRAAPLPGGTVVGGAPADGASAERFPVGGPSTEGPLTTLADGVPADGSPAGGSSNEGSLAGGPPGRARRFVSCGPPIPGFEVRIVDARGSELDERLEGAVEFRGPSTTSGYFRNPAATRALFDGEWLRSGDRGYMAGGELYVTGRDKDLIVRAGRNLYPYDLETAVGEIDGVRKGCVAVFAGADPGAGTERLVVVAETREEDPRRKREIVEAIARTGTTLLGSGPDEIVLAPPHSVLKTSSGKIRRGAVRDLFESGALRRGAASVRMQIVRLALAAVRGMVRSWTRRAARAAYAVYAGAVAGFTLALAWPVVVIAPGSGRARWRRGRVLVRAACGALGIRLRVSGAPNLPEDGERYVVVANHASYLDGPLLFAALPAPVGYIVKGELEGNGFLAPLLRALGAEFVHRLDHERSVADVSSLASRLHHGAALGFFPEGTLHRMPGLLPFRLGAFSVAVDGEAPVVPVTIVGSRSVLRDGQWVPRPGPVSIRIAPPIAPPGPPSPGSAVETDREGPSGSDPRAAPFEPDRSLPDGGDPRPPPVAPVRGGPEPSNREGPSGSDPGRPRRSDGGASSAPLPASPVGSDRVSSGASGWARAVKLRDAARAVILAQCGEPDLGARHDVLDALRRRKRAEGMG